MASIDSQITPKVYTVREVQRLLNLGRSSVYEAITRGDIPTIRIGKRLLIPRVAIDQILAKAGGSLA